MESRHVKARAMIMRRATRQKERTTGEGTSKEVTIELDITVAELHRNKKWRRQLRKDLETKGLKVEAINTLSVYEDGHHVVVVIAPSTEEIKKRKPVTRGGRPIKGPVTARTVKSVLRS